MKKSSNAGVRSAFGAFFVVQELTWLVWKEPLATRKTKVTTTVEPLSLERATGS
jgi:hypothetical protein